eukprot:5536311-Amphidinium_carterae.1
MQSKTCPSLGPPTQPLLTEHNFCVSPTLANWYLLPVSAKRLTGSRDCPRVNRIPRRYGLRHCAVASRFAHNTLVAHHECDGVMNE